MRRPRATTIRSALTRLVLVSVSPIWLASALLLYKVQVDARAFIERDARATARALMVAVDRDLTSARAAALILSLSPNLLSGDLRAFYNQAHEVSRSDVGTNIAVTDASGRQVLNTLRPYGEPLPLHGNPALVQRVFATAKPAISDLYVGGVRKRPVISIDLPVVRDGKVLYDLSIGLFPERLEEILRQEGLPADWTASIFDSRGTIVAHTETDNGLVGQKGPADLVDRMAQSSEGVMQTTTPTGIALSEVFTRSNVSDWSLAIGVPNPTLYLQLWKSLGLSFASTMILLVLGLAGARLMARRLAQPIQALEGLAVAHGHGEPVQPQPLHLKEASDVASALAAASRRLVRRTAERDRANERRHRLLLEKRLAEEEIRTRSAYFAYLSHELGSPLMAVREFSRAIAQRIRRSLPDETCLGYCERIETTVDHLTDLVGEILAYARYEANEIELHLEELDVAAQIVYVVNLMEAKARRSRITLKTAIASDLPPLFADPMRLRQILLNLLSNALKFTPRSGTVKISAEAEDGDIVIRVADTGVGISPGELSYVLHPFAQAANGLTSEPEGTGLGLPFSKGLAELHGGSLTLESAVGLGTTVTVRLPLRPQGTEMSDESRRRPVLT